MPRPHPPEFRRRAVELARERAKPISVLARDLGISESCLRNWMVKADIEDGRREGPNTDERAELVELRRAAASGGYGERGPPPGCGLLRPGERPPKMTYAFIAQRCGDLPVAACCRVMEVSTSGFYAWRANPVSDRDWDEAQLTNKIVDIHHRSRGSYASPRVHADLRLGEDVRCGRKRVERLMRQAKIAGIYRRKGHGCTRRNPDATPAEDLVQRQFTVRGPDRLWVMDITEHRTDEGNVYVAVVLDA